MIIMKVMKSVKTKVFKNTLYDIIFGSLPAVLLTAAVAFTVLLGLRQIEVSTRAEGRRLLEESIMSAVVRHYAIEGNYPPSVTFIEENYGVYIDRERYAVHYDIFASNIVPAVTVTEL